MGAKIVDRHWNVLLDAIECGSCIPMLGADLCVVGEGGARTNLDVDLSHELAAIVEEDRNVQVAAPGDFSLVAQAFENAFSRSELVSVCKAFYESRSQAGHQDPTLDALTSLPFPLFITSRHDTLLQSALERQGKAPRVKSYHFRGDRPPALRDLGSVEEPLVYQLYGTFEDRNSLVITESDLLDFLRAVMAAVPGLPVDLCNLFQNNNVLFLGFGLGSYRLRVLLHALSLNKSNMSFALENARAADHQMVFEDQFEDSVQFYSHLGYNALKLMDMPLEDFITDLHERWSVRHPEGAVIPAPADVARAPRVSGGPRVFISYVKEDQGSAERLSERLREEGLNPWIDQEGLRFGDQWSDKLEDTVSKDVDYFVVLQSRALNERKESYVFKEVSIALERQSMRRSGRFIFPIKIDQDAELLEPIERAKIQSGTIYDWSADVRALANEIRRDFEAG